MEIDKRVIKYLKQLKKFWKDAKRKASLDNRPLKEIAECEKVIKELDELIEKYK